MAEQQVTLQPSESTPVSFEAIPHEAKTYQVSVDGLTGSFRAMECAPGATECREADLYVCSSQGRWELAEANAPQCMVIPPLQQILDEIEAGTWTASASQLAAISNWPTEDYQAAIDAAYAHAAEGAAEGETVWWSPERGYYTAPAEPPWEDIPYEVWEDIPYEVWEDVPWEDVPYEVWNNQWDNWPDYWDRWLEEPPWDDWDNWNDAPPYEVWNNQWDNIYF